MSSDSQSPIGENPSKPSESEALAARVAKLEAQREALLIALQAVVAANDFEWAHIRYLEFIPIITALGYPGGADINHGRDWCITIARQAIAATKGGDA